MDIDSRLSPKQQWVCPSDRQLALRAKLQTGWSVKSHTIGLYSPKKQSAKLDQAEQDVILAVIKRAEDLDRLEQERIGKLKERLDNMKRNAVGSGINQCILCGAHCLLFSMLGSSRILCQDCKKAVCHKCGVETISSSKKDAVWRCKICAETREMWKKSGAWFIKAFPKHIMPSKKPLIQESKLGAIRKPGYDYNSAHLKTPDLEEESSSDEERASRMLALRKKTGQNTSISINSQQQTSWYNAKPSSSFEKKKTSRVRSSSFGLLICDSLNSLDFRKSDGFKKSQQTFKNDVSEGSESSSSHLVSKPNQAQSNLDPKCYNKVSIPHAQNLNSYDSDQTVALENDNGLPQTSLNCSFQDSQLSFLSLREWCSESDRGSISSSSMNGYRTDAGASYVDEGPDDIADFSRDGSLGTLELTLVYDSMASSIHVSLHRAKNLKPMDINGLADPFCKLNLLPPGTKSHRLRTRTVHKSRNPEFNEVLTFYGVTETDMATRALHVIVLDDDKYGHDFMGEARYPLDRLRPDITRELHFVLEKHYPVENEEFVWGEESMSRGQILITLCFSTKKRALVVGIARCTNLTPMDNNGFSDPFVKLFLKPDPYHKKYKTSVKWKNLNPIFNEEFLFETKMTELPQQTLVITVWDKDYGKSNDYLGCLELGCKSKGERLRHWVDMIKFPDHKHEGWHSLCDDLPPR